MIGLSSILSLAVQHWKITAVAGAILVLGIVGCQYRSSLIDMGADRERIRQDRASQKDAANADKAEQSPKMLNCHARQNLGS